VINNNRDGYFNREMLNLCKGRDITVETLVTNDSGESVIAHFRGQFNDIDSVDGEDAVTFVDVSGEVKTLLIQDIVSMKDEKTGKMWDRAV